MYVSVGRFRFRPMSDEERAQLTARMNRDVPPIAMESPGFVSVHFAKTEPDELTAVWVWESEKHWDEAFPRFLPALQEYVMPRLAEPPARAGGEVVLRAGG